MVAGSNIIPLTLSDQNTHTHVRACMWRWQATQSSRDFVLRSTGWPLHLASSQQTVDLPKPMQSVLISCLSLLFFQQVGADWLGRMYLLHGVCYYAYKWGRVWRVCVCVLCTLCTYVCVCMCVVCTFAWRLMWSHDLMHVHTGVCPYCFIHLHEGWCGHMISWLFVQGCMHVCVRDLHT